MGLDYTVILACFVDMIKAAIPISLFLVLADILIDFFFSHAFPKFSRRGD